MYPLLEAHMLAILNGGRFDAADPAYFWQTVSFAIDGCGLEFYSAETVGNALVLSRGVVEEIASGLFESASDLPEIPDALAGGGYSVSVLNAAEENGVLRLTLDLVSDADGAAVASFTAELVENTRAGNSLFTYAVRSIEQR